MTMTRIGKRLFYILATLAPISSATAQTQDTDLPLPAYEASHTMSQNPARFFGPRMSAEISDGVMSGVFAGKRFTARVAGDTAQGAGPSGPIDVRMSRAGDGYEVSGIWNGRDIHFIFDGRTIRGAAVKQVSDGASGLASCHFYIGPTRQSAGYSGREECLGLSEPLQFEVAPDLVEHVNTPEGVLLFVAYLTSPLPASYRR
jgi:hypothetical protein